MPLDKLVDSAQLDSDLEDVADAIRAKSGGSSQLSFPSGFVSEIGSIPSPSGYSETGTVSFHTGEALGTLTVPVSSSLLALDDFVIAIRPIKTWVLVGGVWTERNSLDFTGTTGFKSGNWNPVLEFVVGAKCTTNYTVKEVDIRYSGKGRYSNGTVGNNLDGSFTIDSTNNYLTFSSLNGSKVCVTDCGLTFEYVAWGWNYGE